MKAWDFDAVIFRDEVYCTGCLPPGIHPDNEGVDPIFASSEWDYAPVCCVCGETHTYMSIIGDMPW